MIDKFCYQSRERQKRAWIMIRYSSATFKKYRKPFARMEVEERMNGFLKMAGNGFAGRICDAEWMRDEIIIWFT
jgi:hypothetical protein